MAKLSMQEAKSLAKVFGEPDKQRMTLLLSFEKPRSQFDVLQRMKNLPKVFRVPRATLYRKVKGLYDEHFLDLIEEKEFVKGNLRGTVRYYRLTFKGYLAGFIYAYLFLIDSKTPSSLKEKVEFDDFNKAAGVLESSPSWSFIVNFLRWHNKKNFDLSHAKIDIIYFALTLGLSMLEMPESISEEDLRALSEVGKPFGMIPPQDPNAMLELLKTLSKSIPEFERTLLEMFSLKSGKRGVAFLGGESEK